MILERWQGRQHRSPSPTRRTAALAECVQHDYSGSRQLLKDWRVTVLSSYHRSTTHPLPQGPAGSRACALEHLQDPGWASLVGQTVKESACDAGDLGSIPGLGRSPRGGHSKPLQYPCLKNPHGQRSLVGYSPLRYKELATT